MVSFLLIEVKHKNKTREKMPVELAKNKKISTCKKTTQSKKIFKTYFLAKKTPYFISGIIIRQLLLFADGLTGFEGACFGLHFGELEIWTSLAFEKAFAVWSREGWAVRPFL
jgi:hypothetical protein